MSGLYNNPIFSPARAASPFFVRHTPDVAESQYLAELIAEHQKLGPFMDVLPICSRLLNQEIFRVSGVMPRHGFGEFDGLRHGSPSSIASPSIMSNYSGTGGLGGWNGLLQEEEAIRRRTRHENDPLHILIEAKLSGHVVDKRLRQAQEVIEGWLKPMDEPQDNIKRRQLQELAILNSSFLEESPEVTAGIPSFNTIGMKRAKTGC